MRKLVRHVMPVVVAAGIGPVIAAIAISLFAAVSDIGADEVLDLTDTLKVFFFYVTFAYFFGGVIAFLAGIIVSIWMIWREPNALVAAAAAAIATCILTGLGALGLFGPAAAITASANFYFTLALAVIAAEGCWLLTRWFLPRVAVKQA